MQHDKIYALTILILCICGIPQALGATYYVNTSSAACDNTHTTVEAQNPASPWCSIQTGLNNLNASDRLRICAGTYWLTSSATIADENIANSYIEDCGDGESIITSSYRNATVTPNTNWTLVSTVGGYKIYNSTFTVTNENGKAQCYLQDYNIDIPFFSDDIGDYADLFDNSLTGTSFLYDDDAALRHIVLKLPTTLGSPTSLSMWCGTYRAFTLDNITGPVTIANLTFKGLTYGVYTGTSSSASTQVTIKSNNFTGTLVGVYVYEDNKNWNITNNTFWNDFYDDYFHKNAADTHYFIKNSDYEKWQIVMQEADGNISITDNSFYGHFNQIGAYDGDLGENANITITNNLFNKTMDDAIELENYTGPMYIANNTILNCFTCFSFMPMNASQGKINFSYNIINATSAHYNGNTSHSYGECFKYSSSGTYYVQNLSIDHNTCVGPRAGFSAGTSVSLRYVNYTNNILYSPISTYRIWDWTGLATLGNWYDYNLYYSRYGNYARYYNSASNSTIFPTVATAIASTVGAASGWDTHSNYSNPLLADYANGNYTPAINSPACNMSDTGSYVGALPCEPPAIEYEINENASELEMAVIITDPDGNIIPTAGVRIEGAEYNINPSYPLGLTLYETYEFEYFDSSNAYISDTDDVTIDGNNITKILYPNNIYLEVDGAAPYRLTANSYVTYGTGDFNMSPNDLPYGPVRLIYYYNTSNTSYTPGYFEFYNNRSLNINESLTFTTGNTNVSLQVMTTSGGNLPNALAKFYRINHAGTDNISLIAQKLTGDDGTVYALAETTYAYRIVIEKEGFEPNFVSVDENGNGIVDRIASFFTSGYATIDVYMQPLLMGDRFVKSGAIYLFLGSQRIFNMNDDIGLHIDSTIADTVEILINNNTNQSVVNKTINDTHELNVLFKPNAGIWGYYINNSNFTVDIYYYADNQVSHELTINFTLMQNAGNYSALFSEAPVDKEGYTYLPIILLIGIIAISGIVNYTTKSGGEGYGMETFTVGMAICSLAYPLFILAALPGAIDWIAHFVKAMTNG